MKYDAQSAHNNCCQDVPELVAWEEMIEPSVEEMVSRDEEIAAQEEKFANTFWTCRQGAEGEMADEVRDRNDELLRNFAPSFKKHIEDALAPIVGPVVAVLQSHGEAERKQRQTFLALEEKKLALRSEKIQLQRRRRGRICQVRRRASSEKSSRLRIRQGLRLLSLSQ